MHGHTAWVWDPQTGDRHLLPWTPGEDTLTLTLGPVASMLIVLEPRSATGNEQPVLASQEDATGKAKAIRSEWTVILEPVSGKPETLKVSDLQSPALTRSSGWLRRHYHMFREGADRCSTHMLT